MKPERKSLNRTSSSSREYGRASTIEWLKKKLSSLFCSQNSSNKQNVLGNDKITTAALLCTVPTSSMDIQCWNFFCFTVDRCIHLFLCVCVCVPDICSWEKGGLLLTQTPTILLLHILIVVFFLLQDTNTCVHHFTTPAISRWPAIKFHMPRSIIQTGTPSKILEQWEKIKILIE